MVKVTIQQKNRCVIALQGGTNDYPVTLYTTQRLKVAKLIGKNWKIRLNAIGAGTVTPVFYGYNAAGKICFFRQLPPLKITAKGKQPWSLVEPEKIFTGATSIAAGFMLQGQVRCFSALFQEAKTAEVIKLRRQSEQRKAVQNIYNGSFEKVDGWKLILHDGAQGKIEQVQSPRSGQYALKLTKTNDQGFCQLVSEHPVELYGRQKYVMRGYYQTQNAKFNSLLLFRLTPELNEQTFAYDSVDRSAGVASQSFAINCNPGKFLKRVISHRPPKDVKRYAQILLVGGACEVVLDDIEIAQDNYKRSVPPGMAKRTTFPYSHAEVIKILQKRHNQVAQVVKRNGRAMLLLNQRPVVPAFYKCEPYESNYIFNRYQEFEEAQVPFALRTVQISAAAANSGIVLAPGKYDFPRLVKVLDYALRQNPQANLVIDFMLNEPYPGWGMAHPSELWRNKDNQFGWGVWGNCQGFTASLQNVKLRPHEKNWHLWPFGSYSSKSYREAHARNLTDLVKYLMQSPYGKAIVGFHIGGGHDAQFQYGRPDFSRPAQRSFQKFLRQKYGTIENLNRSCGTLFASFESVEIPEKSRKIEGNSPLVHDINFEYKAFQNYESFGIKDYFAKVIKKAAGKPVFVTSYGLPTTYPAETACRSENGVDFFAVASWYPYRNPGYPVGEKPDATFHEHGKFHLAELDLRTWTGSERNEVRDQWLSSALDLETWHQVHRKMVGISLAHRSAWWYYTMFRYFDRPEIMADIKRVMTIARQVWRAPEIPFRPGVCVIRTDSADWARNCGIGSSENTTSNPWQLQQFEISGVPYDLHSLADVLRNPQLQNYSMYVFMHNVIMSRTERQQIKTLLQKPGRTLVYMYNTGYIDFEQGKSTRWMTELTGWPITTTEKFGRLSAQLVATHPLGRGIDGTCSGGEVLFNRFALRGACSFFARYQIFHPQETDDTRIIARFSDGSPAIVGRQMGNCQIIYAAPPFALNAELFNRLARQSGAYICGAPGQSIVMNGNFVSLHGTTPGEYTFILPPGTQKMTDWFTKQQVPVVNGQCKLVVEVGKTYWFKLEK